MLIWHFHFYSFFVSQKCLFPGWNWPVHFGLPRYPVELCTQWHQTLSLYSHSFRHSDIMVMGRVWSFGHHEHYGHFDILVIWHSGHFDILVILTFWSFWHSGHFDILVILTFWSFWHSGHFDIMVILTLWSFWHYGHFDIMVILTLWSFWHYGHFDIMIIWT